jgi:hypothetical protein
VETPRKLITAKLSIRKHQAISTDKDPGLRIERLAVINLRDVSTNKKYYINYDLIGKIDFVLFVKWA